MTQIKNMPHSIGAYLKGVGVESVELDANNHLIVHLDNGETVDAGEFKVDDELDAESTRPLANKKIAQLNDLLGNDIDLIRATIGNISNSLYTAQREIDELEEGLLSKEQALKSLINSAANQLNELDEHVNDRIDETVIDIAAVNKRVDQTVTDITAVNTRVDEAVATIEANMAETEGGIALLNEYSEAERAKIREALVDKVDKVEGKGLSTNDYTNEEKEQVERVRKLSAEILNFQVVGNDTILVYSDIKRTIVPGHRYRLTIKNPDIDMSGVGNLSHNYTRLSIVSYNAANVRTKLAIEAPVSLPLLPYYDVVLPEDSEGLGIAMRATKGEILEVYVEDVTLSLTNAEKLIYEATGEVPMGNMNPGFYTGGSLNSFSYRDQIRSWLVPVKAGKLYHLKGKKVRSNLRLYNNEGNEILKDTEAYFHMSSGENLKIPVEYGDGLRLQIAAELDYGDIPEDFKLYEDVSIPQMPIEGDFSLDMESVEYDGKVGTELQATKFAEIYSRYDALVSAYPNNMSKKLLGYGTATDGSADTTLPIYEYTFAPLVGNDKNSLKYEGEIPFPNYAKKIILTSGVHGREKISVEAVYKFMENVCKGENSQFASLASNFVIKVIPLVNPFSYDDFSRLNKRGVNINRNLGYSWDNQDIHDATDKGSAAYSEKESQILRDWLRENSDAILYVDAHDSMYFSQYANVAAYVCSADDDILQLGASHIKVESRKVWNDNPSLAKKIYGFIASQKGAVTYWEGASVGIKASSTIEINDYFFNNEMFNQYAIELHCWAVYNWILANIQYALKK